MESIKHRTFEVIQIGKDKDKISIIFDLFITLVIFISLFVTLFETFSAAEPYMGLLSTVELITMIIFALEYILRISDRYGEEEEPGSYSRWDAGAESGRSGRAVFQQ